MKFLRSIYDAKISVLSAVLLIYLGGVLATSWACVYGGEGIFASLAWPYVVCDLWYFILFPC